jgi:hypothetical protein
MRAPENLKYIYTLKANVYKTLIGNLYPSIVYKELVVLKTNYIELTGVDDLPFVRPPGDNGRII